MRMRLGMFSTLGLISCGPPPGTGSEPEPVTHTEIHATVFSLATDDGSLPAIKTHFPAAKVEVIDHALYPDAARRSQTPSNGYVHLIRKDKDANNIGQAQLIALNASDDVFANARAALQSSLFSHRSFNGDFSSSANSKSKKTASLLYQTLSSQGIVESSQETADLFLILAPQDDLTVEESKQIEKHRLAGGAILVALEPESPGITGTRLSTLLKDLGVEMRDGIVASEDGQVWEKIGQKSPGDEYNHATARFLPHPSNRSLSNPRIKGLSVVFSKSAAIQPRRHSKAKSKPTVLSHPKAWIEIDGDGTQGANEKSDSTPLVIAAEHPGKHNAKSIVFSDSTALSDRWALHPGNKILIRDSIAWLLPDTVPSPATQPDPLPEDARQVPIFEKQSPLREIQLIQPEQRLRIQQRKGKAGNHSWVIKESNTGSKSLSFRGNAKVDAIWKTFEPLHTHRTWNNPPKDRLQALGLDQPIATLRLIRENGRSHDLELGGTPYQTAGRYALHKATNRAFLLSKEDLAVLFATPQSLEDFRVLPDDKWMRVEMPRTRGTQRIEPRTEHWIVSGESSTKINDATEMMQTLLSLRVMRPANLKEEVPETAIKLTTRLVPIEGKATNFKIAYWGEQWLGYSDHTRIWVVLPQPKTKRVVELYQILE